MQTAEFADAGSTAPRVHSHHVPDHDHDHDDEAVLPLEDNPIWQQDNVTLVSVGMDIGSSGTQVLFSRLHLRRIGEDLTSRYIVIDRRSLYRSPVSLTPYQGELIDTDLLGDVIDRAYSAAAIEPQEVDTGVVILTGEALRRRNARRIADVLADRGGELVTATAGHNMEAMLAAYGSGAARVSFESSKRVLNVDIGGGTTKLAMIDRGRVVATAAVRIGGRLQVVVEGRTTRLEPSGAWHAQRAGVPARLGGRCSASELDATANSMAELLLEVIGPVDPRRAAEVPDLYLTDPLPAWEPQAVMFSGGVAEYIYGREDRDFGDLGRRIGAAVRQRLEAGALGDIECLPAGECIRATALGASEYSVQLSGNTSFISDPDRLLPRRNLQVVRPRYDIGEQIDVAAISAAISSHLQIFDADDPEREVAIALEWSGLPSYERLSAFAAAITRGLQSRSAPELSTFLLLDGDVAMNLGHLLREEGSLPGELLVIDGLSLRDFDYIDIGRLRHPSNTVPVTIKSMVFSEGDPHS